MSEKLKQELTFTVLMVLVMATTMISYNAVLTSGFTIEALQFALMQIIPAVVIAFLLEWFIVGKNVHKIHRRILKPEHPKLAHIVVLALLFVTSMSGLMSLYATLLIGGDGAFLGRFFANWAHNWPVALAVQLPIAGPIVRAIHPKLIQAK